MGKQAKTASELEVNREASGRSHRFLGDGSLKPRDGLAFYGRQPSEIPALSSWPTRSRPTLRAVWVRRMNHGTTGARGPNLSVNKVNWQKVGRVTGPGRYMLPFGYLLITAEDLEIWKQFPNAEFALVAQPFVGCCAAVCRTRIRIQVGRVRPWPGDG
jgi:hypothetical protein